MWQITREVIKDNPIIGVGLGHLPFKYAFESYIRTMPVFHSHNTYLQTLAEMGILGFILFMITLGTVYFYGTKTLLRHEDRFFKIIGAGLLAGLTGILVHGMFENILYLMKITTTFWIVISMIFVLGRIAQKEQRTLGDDRHEKNGAF